MKGLFTVDEAAEKLGVTSRTIYSYLKDGKLSSRKEGKRLHIPAGDIEKLQSPTVTYDPQKNNVIDRGEYEELIRAKTALKDLENLRHQHDGLLVKLGQLEAEVRFTREENQKLLSDLNFRDEKKLPWWKRVFAR